MTRATRITVRVLAAFSAAGAIAGCGATSLAIPKISSFGVGPAPSVAGAEKYGEVSIPGKKVVALPKGDVALYFSDFVQGGADNVENGSVPAMNIEVSGPGGGRCIQRSQAGTERRPKSMATYGCRSTPSTSPRPATTASG